MVKRLQDVFPFPVHIVEFNTASCYIVDKVSHGVPAHAIQFSHNDGAQINHHDRLGIDYILYNGLEVQEVILSAPAIRSGGPKKLPDPDAPKRPPVTRKRALVYGARRRAALAGIHLTNR
ncbi:MAG TPA: hypothetical protein VFE77_03140 [Rhodanobacter sp.]|nr:hypothetical protein [Rhodanobacter sp.]